MAESVDALVSNTSGATHPGSIPGLGTETEKVEKLSPFSFLYSQPIGYLWAHLQILGGLLKYSRLFSYVGASPVCAPCCCVLLFGQTHRSAPTLRLYIYCVGAHRCVRPTYAQAFIRADTPVCPYVAGGYCLSFIFQTLPLFCNKEGVPVGGRR